jgi:hypothetical protein
MVRGTLVSPDSAQRGPLSCSEAALTSLPPSMLPAGLQRHLLLRLATTGVCCQHQTVFNIAMSPQGCDPAFALLR